MAKFAHEVRLPTEVVLQLVGSSRLQCFDGHRRVVFIAIQIYQLASIHRAEQTATDLLTEPEEEKGLLEKLLRNNG